MASYFKNYNMLVTLTKDKCRNIYRTNSSGIPLKLSEKLKNSKDYFNYNPYFKDNNLI